MLRAAALLATALLTQPAAATPLTGTFASIDGGTLSIEDYRGRPMLVVNTASLCGFTPQFAALQEVHETYGPKGLVVLAIPSNDFRQELGSAEEVQDFCELNYGLTLPMTDITSVRGSEAHPFYRSLQAQGFVPRWNFNKVLLDAEGNFRESWGSTTRPNAPVILRAVEALLSDPR